MDESASNSPLNDPATRRTPRTFPEGGERRLAASAVFADYTCVARFDGKELVLESVSEGFARVTGYTRDEFNAQGGAAFAVHPDDLLVALRSLDRLVSGESDSNEIRITRKGGEVRWLRYLARPERDAARAGVVRIHGAVLDVTERKLGREVLEESERRFRQLAENIQEGFWLSDPLKSQVLYCSPAFAEIWGRSCDDLYERPWSFLDSVHPEDRGPVVRALERHGRGEPTDLEYRVVRPDESVRWVRERSFPIKDPSGRVYRVAGVAEDVTERRQAEEQRRLLEDLLRRRNQELAAADRHKDEFLAMLAHELRNPLAPIRNALHIMKHAGNAGPVVEQVRDVAERQVRHMARLLDDLLDVARISRGRIDLRRETVAVASILRQAVEAVRPLIEERRHELTVAPPAEPLWVDADPTRLEQVLTNLLNNAAKYTDPGGRIGLGAGREGDEVVVRVRDTGVGIAPDMLPRIFDLFVQAERRLDRSQGGVGIGLTLVRRLVELHGGTVEAFSPGLGRGSEFVVRLPASAPATSAPAESGAGAAAAPTRRRILVTDDNRDAADSLALMLTMMGGEVRTAYDGLAAVEAAAAFRPDVIVLDVGMPGLNGYDAARRIREQAWGKDMVLIALTGWGQEGDRRRSEEAGFDHHLTKPVEPGALERLLADRTPPKRRTGAGP